MSTELDSDSYVAKLQRSIQNRCARVADLEAEVERLRGALEAIPKIAFPNAWESIPYQKACTVAKNALKP